MRSLSRVRRGLTLLELLVVVFIMAALAGAAVTLTDNIDQQSRYEDTMNRLGSIRYAILGDARPQPDGKRLLSGFVADVGRLPLDIDELTAAVPASGVSTRTFSTGTDWSRPVFFNTASTSTALGMLFGGYSSTASGCVTLSNSNIPRGWRGPYVRSTTVNTPFRDGWGTVSTLDDAANHGWLVPPHDPFSAFGIASVGADGVQDVGTPVDPYARDASDTISLSQWTVPAADLQLSAISNSTTYSGSEIGIAIVSYVDGGWLRVDSNLRDMPATGQSYPFAFTSGIVPQGRQIAVVFQYGADTAPFTADDVVLKEHPIDIIAGTRPSPLTISFP